MSVERPIRIAPSILASNFVRLADEVAAIEKGGADWVHVDVMDGHFVPNITIGIPVVQSLRKVTDLPIDTHLMIENADAYVADFAKAGSDYISVHVEACPHLHRTLHLIRENGAKAGVVLNPATPLESIEPVLEDLDYVLLMTVNPGFGGQSFIPSVLTKVKRLHRWIVEKGLSIDIQVDGGVSPKTIEAARKAGANNFVAGSAVFKTDDYGAAIGQLRTLAESVDIEA